MNTFSTKCTGSNDPALDLMNAPSSLLIPERHLMICILQRAFDDLRVSTNVKDRRLAVEWFCDTDDRYQFSYLHIKDTLDLDLRWVRAIQVRLHEALVVTPDCRILT